MPPAWQIQPRCNRRQRRRSDGLSPLTVIASGAKQSTFSPRCQMDCFTPLVVTETHGVHAIGVDASSSRLNMSLVEIFVIASVAKQSTLRSRCQMDCFAALAMTARASKTSYQRFVEVLPFRIEFLDQCQFLRATACFDLLLAYDRLDHGVVQFVPDQHLATIFF